LLYRFERPQYAEIRKKYVTGPNVVVGQEKEMSAIYGAEHLLRMLGAF
jgi:mortality factor 4-like protein 1